MKKVLIIFAALAILVIGVYFYPFSRNSEDQVIPEPGVADKILTVTDLCTRPERFTGDIKILGVVRTIKNDKNLFGLADIDDPDASQPSGCSSCGDLTVPVLNPGEMPEIGDRVIVTGRVEESPEGLVFAAKEVEKQ